MNADFQRAIAEMTRQIIEIEEKIAEIAWFLTDPDRRDRLQWIEPSEPWSDEFNWYVPARSIACRL